ncbi:hypothetical protein [Arthrobacter sp. LFS091]|uniref:hypothetical protein n=1 Tax=Arthrobacter sp. LFS091 TaxID=3229892 RepID=UPI003A80081E
MAEGTDRIAKDQAAPSNGPALRSARTGRIVGLGVLLVVIVLLSSCVYRFVAPLATPSVFGLDRKLVAMPCVTWIDSDPRGGNIAVRGPLVSYLIGVSSDCTASDVENILWTVLRGAGDTGADLEGLDLVCGSDR